ncbi:MAG TPA: MFS transporter [Candidatus Paceibacterota bacterium]|nr:MFS transporter [Verrucomicrobiota bacterium]HSA10549.1 MFS transporter [Candidatus Paceibacterota bacterium]
MPPESDNLAATVPAVPEEVVGQPRRLESGVFPWRQTFAALKHRNFRLFFSGQLVSLVGTWMQNTAQSWLVYQLTGSKLLLGIVAAVGTAPLLLFSMWGGSVADRHSKQTVLLWTQSGMMVLAFLFAAVVWTGVVRPWHIMVLAGLGGIAMAFDMPARQAFVVEITSREDLMNAVLLNSSVFNGARVVGPAVAGFLMAQVDLGACFFLNGLSFVAVLAGLLMMRLPRFVPPAQPESNWQHVLDGFAYVAKHRRVRTLLLLVAFVGVFGWSYSVLMPAFATDVLRVGSREYGMLLSANGIGALAGALAVATYGARLPRRLLVFGGLGLFSLMLLLLAVTRNYYVALVWMAIAGWGMLLYISTSNTAIQMSVADGMRGRVMGIWALMFGGMMPLGGLEAGVLSHWVGVPWTVAIGAMGCGTAALVAWLFVRRSPQSAQ